MLIARDCRSGGEAGLRGQGACGNGKAGKKGRRIAGLHHIPASRRRDREGRVGRGESIALGRGIRLYLG